MQLEASKPGFWRNEMQLLTQGCSFGNSAHNILHYEQLSAAQALMRREGASHLSAATKGPATGGTCLETVRPHSLCPDSLLRPGVVRVCWSNGGQCSSTADCSERAEDDDTVFGKLSSLVGCGTAQRLSIQQDQQVPQLCCDTMHETGGTQRVLDQGMPLQWSGRRQKYHI